MCLHGALTKILGESKLYLPPSERQLLYHPQKQPPRHSSIDHSEAVKEEVTKLKQVGAIKEVFYPK